MSPMSHDNHPSHLKAKPFPAYFHPSSSSEAISSKKPSLASHKLLASITKTKFWVSESSG